MRWPRPLASPRTSWEANLPWANTIHRRVTSPPGAASAVALNADVAATLAKDWARAGLKKLPAEVPHTAGGGDGSVALRGRDPSQRQP